MVIGKKMVKANFENDHMTILISVDKFNELWDDSYADEGGYNIKRFSQKLKLDYEVIDLDSFVADMVLSMLDDRGNEDEDVNNEFFENYGAENCVISSVKNGVVTVRGDKLKL